MPRDKPHVRHAMLIGLAEGLKQCTVCMEQLTAICVPPVTLANSQLVIGATKHGISLRNVQPVTTQKRANCLAHNAKMVMHATTVLFIIKALKRKTILCRNNYVPGVSFAKPSAMLSKRHSVQMANT